MAQMAIAGDLVTFELSPWHALCAWRRRIRVRLDQIIAVAAPARQALLRPHLRLPGAHLPWLLTTGTFVGLGQREFWDATRCDQVLTITLQGHEFTKLVIEVDDPAAAMRLLGQAVASTPRSSQPRAATRGGAHGLRLDRDHSAGYN